MKNDKNLPIYALFVILSLLDLGFSLTEGHRLLPWLRPAEWIAFILLILLNYKPTVTLNLLLLSTVFGILDDYYYYSFKGDTTVYFSIIFQIAKNLCFVLILLIGVWGKVKITQKLILWAFLHYFVAFLLCFLMNPIDSFITYLLGFIGFSVFLLISISRMKHYIFKQTYFGMLLIVMSAVFASIYLLDNSLIVEIINRFSQTIGNILFYAGILEIQILSNKQEFES